jgi:D-amino-acid oxidase
MLDAYSHLAPMIDTDVYLAWLLARVREAGCRVDQRRIIGPLAGQEASLRREYHADVIVNCAGLGAAELASDHVYPLRGALVRVCNDGRAMPRVTEAHCVAADEAGQREFVFILPRGNETLLLGGIAEPDEWRVDIGLENHEPVRRMLARCVEFLPVLKDAEIDEAEPVRVGLRPVRRQNVRLEQEPGTRVIHNYGHGGSGVTLSWGCAMEVVEMAERMLSPGPRPLPDASLMHAPEGGVVRG